MAIASPVAPFYPAWQDLLHFDVDQSKHKKHRLIVRVQAYNNHITSE